MNLDISTITKFWSRVNQLDNYKCWPWLAGKNKKGYGVFWIETKLPIYAHRLAYYLRYRENIIDFDILHHCDNPTCCNPSHLFKGTHTDNMNDKISKGRAIGNPPKHYEGEIFLMRRLFSAGISLNKISKMFRGNSSYIGALIRNINYRSREDYNEIIKTFCQNREC